MSLFTVWYTYSDDTALRDTVRPDHRAFLGELAAEGTIVLSGPVSSPEGAPAAALLLFVVIFLLTALHTAGLVALTHTPNPMKFLNGLLGRPESEKPIMIIAVGHPAEDAKVPAVAKLKKPLEEILTVAE